MRWTIHPNPTIRMPDHCDPRPCHRNVPELRSQRPAEPDACCTDEPLNTATPSSASYISVLLQVCGQSRSSLILTRFFRRVGIFGSAVNRAQTSIRINVRQESHNEWVGRGGHVHRYRYQVPVPNLCAPPTCRGRKPTAISKYTICHPSILAERVFRLDMI